MSQHSQFQTATFWCPRCHAGTLHECTVTGTNCVPCNERKRGPTLFVNEPSNTEAFRHALDGMGYRGEGRREEIKKKCNPR